MKIVEVVAKVITSPRDILLIDTCSILDVARLARSNSSDSLDRELIAIDEIIEKTQQDAIWILLVEEVTKELARNKENVFNETKQWAQTLQTDLKKLCRLHGGIPNVFLTDEQLRDVSAGLESRISTMTELSLVIAEDTDCFNRGSKRNNNRVPPGSLGKEQGDCIIYEHYLDCARQLRQGNFDRKIIYLTSNTSDYCQSKSSTLKTEISSELEAVQISFVTKWQWGLSQISI